MEINNINFTEKELGDKFALRLSKYIGEEVCPILDYQVRSVEATEEGYTTVLIDPTTKELITVNINMI